MVSFKKCLASKPRNTRIFAYETSFYPLHVKSCTRPCHYTIPSTFELYLRAERQIICQLFRCDTFYRNTFTSFLTSCVNKVTLFI